jgi:Uma2 family endonuclease
MSLTTPIVLPKQLHRRSILPTKLDDRLDLSPEIRAKATFEEFIELSIAAEYRVEYLNGYVISIFDYDKINDTMSTASITHENIVMNMGSLLFNLFRNNSEIRILGSNTPVFINEHQGVCNPDVTVVVGEPITRQYKWRKKNKTVLVNPHIVVEVLSQGTRDYDLNEKLASYQQVEHIQQIIFVEQYFTEVISYARLDAQNWSKEVFEHPENSLSIGTLEISLADIYTKIVFQMV